MMAPSVFQRTKSPRSSPGNLPRKLQNGTEPPGQLDPTADSSPGNSISDAENFECYGEADGDVPVTLENGTRSPGNPLNRHSWTRTSLRRTPPSHQENLPHRRWGSMRQRRDAGVPQHAPVSQAGVWSSAAGGPAVRWQRTSRGNARHRSAPRALTVARRVRPDRRPLSH